MKALVISGGGSKGAFAGGITEFLLKECQEHYDILVGTSTGSLMIPLIALEKRFIHQLPIKIYLVCILLSLKNLKAP